MADSQKRHHRLTQLVELLQGEKVEPVEETQRQIRLFGLALQTLQVIVETNGVVEGAQVHKQMSVIEELWKTLPTEQLGVFGVDLRLGYDQMIKECYSIFPLPDPYHQQALNFVKNNPKKILAGAVIGAGAPLLGPALLVGGLNAIGFSAAGPVAGSIAAGLQSSVYGGSILSGSLFSMGQSATMGGVAAASGQAVAAAAAVGASVGSLFPSFGGEQTDKAEKEEKGPTKEEPSSE